MKEIQELIDKLRDKGDFILEDCPEDLNEDKMTFEDLQESYENLYYTLIEIENNIKSI